MRKKLSYLSILLLAVVVVVSIYFDNKTEKVLGETEINNYQSTAIIGTKNPTTGATTTVRLTNNFQGGGSASSTYETVDIGQIGLGCSFTPYESSTKLYWQMEYGTLYPSTTDCNNTGVNWYPAMIQTNTAATGTYDIFNNGIEKRDNNNLVASTSYAFFIPRDWSSSCMRVKFREQGVASAYGTLFCEKIPSN